MNYKLEKETEDGYVLVKELKGIYFDHLKAEIIKLLGNCSITSTDIDSDILIVKLYENDDVYRIICLDEDEEF